MHITLVHPTSGELRSVKIGFSWTLFLFSSLYGIPLFLRGLHAHGAAVAALCFVWLLIFDPALMPIAGLLFLGVAVFYGIKGNQLTLDHLTSRGWHSADGSGMGYMHGGYALASRSAYNDVEHEVGPTEQSGSGEKTCPRCACSPSAPMAQI